MEPGARQRGQLRRLVARLEKRPWFRAAIVVGSLAIDKEDDLSDVDLLVAVSDFKAAWAERAGLEGDEAVASWDANVEPHAGAHKWITTDLVLVECLLGEPRSFRLAEPFRLLAGSQDALARVPRRPTLTRAQVRAGPADPIERAYDEFKEAVRARRGGRDA